MIAIEWQATGGTYVLEDAQFTSQEDPAGAELLQQWLDLLLDTDGIINGAQPDPERQALEWVMDQAGGYWLIVDMSEPPAETAVRVIY